uniref:Uncharacterized protein n=1 Tax=Arundo donax TaxID=35708 RepID=A0A0A9HH91_ARUDO
MDYSPTQLTSFTMAGTHKFGPEMVSFSSDLGNSMVNKVQMFVYTSDTKFCMYSFKSWQLGWP